tara:strand:- start:139 stop:711 length:573 start_codon:yes stop_codon:yes gene_type:complete
MNNYYPDGTTYTSNSAKVPKNNIIIKFIGELDELSAEICYINTLIYKYFVKYNSCVIHKYFNILYDIQIDIHKQEKIIQEANCNDTIIFKTPIIQQYFKELINILPQECKFVLSGGNILIASIFKAIARCRAVERRLVSINYYYYNSEKLTPNEIVNIRICMNYINILSDYFYVLARYTYFILDIEEIAL